MCGKIGACFTGIWGICRSGGTACKNCWWTPDSRFEKIVLEKPEGVKKNLRLYDLAHRIAFVVIVLAEIAGFVLLALAQKTPPPFHSLIGLYVCVGGLALLPIALWIISNRREAYIATVDGLTPDNTHVRADSRNSDDDD